MVITTTSFARLVDGFDEDPFDQDGPDKARLRGLSNHPGLRPMWR